MVETVLDDRSRKPSRAALAELLGRAHRHWEDIVGHALEDHEGVTEEWKFYGPKHGWQLKLKTKTRALLYLVPHRRSFLAGMALDAKALAGLRASGLPSDLVREIEASKTYMEGKPARLEVKKKADAAVVRKLIALKLGTQR
jgi:hypothetical protein